MDHRILEFTARIPMEIKYKNNIPKFLIKEIVHKYIPKDIINRPKKGFSIPIRQWYEDKLHDLFEELLSEKEINKYGILDYNSIKEIIKRYNNNETYLMKVIWQIFIFQLWSRKWL
jgi:asparagine synthase (glutamine-hydrolysing)